MARISIVLGMLLCGLSAAGMIGSIKKDPVQFIPMMFGIPLLFCGVVSLNPHRRRLAMRIAATLTALGGLAGLALIFFRASPQTPDEVLLQKAAFTLAMCMLAICWSQMGLQIMAELQSRRRSSTQPVKGNPNGPHHDLPKLYQSSESEADQAKVPSVKASPDP